MCLCKYPLNYARALTRVITGINTSILEVCFPLPDRRFYCCLISETLELLSAAAAEVGGMLGHLQKLKETEGTHFF